jgi:hypothetical protein
MGRTDRSQVIRFRHHPGRFVAGIVVTVSTVALAAASPWLALLVLIPLVWTLGTWRAGTDVNQDGLEVRALLRRRRIPWSRVSGLGTAPDGQVVASLVDGGAVPLTAVEAGDLPGLVAVSGHKLTRPG